MRLRTALAVALLLSASAVTAQTASGDDSSSSSSSSSGSSIGALLGFIFLMFGVFTVPLCAALVITVCVVKCCGLGNADNANAADSDSGEVGNEHALFEDVSEEELPNFNLGDNNVGGAQLFDEAVGGDARLNELVRDRAALLVLGVGAQRPEGRAAHDEATGALITAQQELAAVVRGEAAPPVEVPPAYAEYSTKSFGRCRWRSPDGRSASFQAHDLFAGILYPYALSVTAYGAASDATHRLGLDYAAWARAIQGASEPAVYGVCVRRAETAAEGKHLMEQAGLRGDWMRTAGTLFVYAVTSFDPERLSVQSLMCETASCSGETTALSAELSPAQRQAIGARVAAEYGKARSEGIYCALHPAAVHVTPHHEQTVSLQDRRPGEVPDEPTAAAELLWFARLANSAADRAAAGSVADAVTVALVGAVTPEPSLAFLNDGSFPIKVDVQCSICYCDVSSVGAHLRGAECCSPARHFVCEECINIRVSVALTDAQTDFTSLPCAMAPACTSVWTFDDFGALVSPHNLRKWNNLSVQHALQEGQRRAQANTEVLQQQLGGGAHVATRHAELRRHVTEVRRCLRPACPHCGVPFESFTGCLSVTCGARDQAGRQVQGCGKEFCGSCMAPTPCPKRCGQRFVSPGQLHTEWRSWRREKVLQYLRANFRHEPQDQHQTDEERGRMLGLTLRAVRADLVTASIHPLGDGFPNPQ